MLIQRMTNVKRNPNLFFSRQKKGTPDLLPTERRARKRTGRFSPGDWPAVPAKKQDYQTTDYQTSEERSATATQCTAGQTHRTACALDCFAADPSDGKTTDTDDNSDQTDEAAPTPRRRVCGGGSVPADAG